MANRISLEKLYERTDREELSKVTKWWTKHMPEDLVDAAFTTQTVMFAAYLVFELNKLGWTPPSVETIND